MISKRMRKMWLVFLFAAVAAAVPAPRPPRLDMLPGFPKAVTGDAKKDVPAMCARADVAPAYWADCCRLSNRYCAELRGAKTNPCVAQVNEPWTPWTMNDRSTMCCPGGMVPTGLRPPDRLCVFPRNARAFRDDIENPRTGVAAASMGPLLFLLGRGLQGGVNVLQCYERVTIYCAGQNGINTEGLVGSGNLNATCRANPAMKQCIEAGYLGCLGGNFLYAIP